MIILTLFAILMQPALSERQRVEGPAQTAQTAGLKETIRISLAKLEGAGRPRGRERRLRSATSVRC
jgi:hypothetical protein